VSHWPERDEAQKILDEWVSDENLKKHSYAVEAAMRAYATRLGGDPGKWAVVGLLHDFDYQRYPDLKDHPFKGASYLREKGYADELIQAILAHAEHTQVERNTDLRRAIFAVDELTGLIVAVALMRPSKKIVDVGVESVMKKWKEKSFARGVDRKLIEKGAEELGISLKEHVEIVLGAMQDISAKLGL
jgi:putative nucleotidyltransferase with HDIG domain